MAEIIVPNAAEYCEKHGYELEILEYPEWGSNTGYEKLELIKEMFLDGDADVIFSMDCDTLITNHKHKVEDYLQEGKDFYITKDVNSFNAGSFIIRKSEWSLYFIDYLLSKRGLEGMYCEQNAIECFDREFPNSKEIKVLPHPSINSYHYFLYPSHEDITSSEAGCWWEGCFVLHLPGLGFEQRLDILKSTKVIK